MKVDIYVNRDALRSNVTFSRQRDDDVHYRAEVPPGSTLSGSDKFRWLVLENGRALCALDVYIYAKVDAEGFRILNEDCGLDGASASRSDAR